MGAVPSSLNISDNRMQIRSEFRTPNEHPPPLVAEESSDPTVRTPLRIAARKFDTRFRPCLRHDDPFGSVQEIEALQRKSAFIDLWSQIDSLACTSEVKSSFSLARAFFAGAISFEWVSGIHAPGFPSPVPFSYSSRQTQQWPLNLSVAVAKTVAQKTAASFKLNGTLGDDIDGGELDSGRLRAESLEALHALCALWLEQPHLADKMAAFPAVALPVSTHAVRNNRRKMEDRHVTLPDLNCVLDIQDAPQHSYYAVFDGHAGLEAANYATAHLHRNIVVQPDFLSDPVHAIHEGFAATDRNFLQRSSKEGMKSGCTAVCCLVREQSHLYVGWLGDSQAMLARRGVALPLVNPHKPEREDERKRIEDLGGMVVMMGIWRVNGSLAVSRAIGDAEHKPYVISEPDVLSVELDGSEDFLVLGCDGLWDQLMPQDVANRVYQAVLDDPDGAPYVSHALVQGARDLGSGDNITAIVVFLRDPHTFDAASLSQAVSCPALEKTAVSELPTPPVGDSGNVFDGPSDDLVQVATGVVRETIETALHRVNDDAAAARDIVEQVHQMHSEQEVGKLTDLPEHFYGAAPVEKSGDDDVVGPANGFLGGTVDPPGGRRNPFEDEGYERDVDAANDTSHVEESHCRARCKIECCREWKWVSGRILGAPR
ncbi:hypothetical protein HPB47_026220 [Ixodes persulcatus]|uniref:Uncharacterized protein n=1 Tax=Ixodes persulcatus TaxID=34615 RepID=A0AC60PZD3_IXOPE|nr:hypothetical protein HPB47_026220 [Ixodes persulcatus]